VPACAKHNTGKSADDEFLLVSLAGIIGNNTIGYRHKFTKVNRTIRRSAFRLLEEALKNPRSEILELEPNKFIQVIWGTPDHERLSKCFDHIARGLFFHHFGKKFNGKTRTLLGFTSNPAANAQEFQRLIRNKVKMELGEKPRIGANPQVFSFQFTELDRDNTRSLHLQFFGGLDVFVGMTPPDWVPQDLAMELIRRGIATTIKDGRDTYVFNSEARS